MSKIRLEDDQRFKDGLIQSLCYLFQESIKEERQDLANILQWSIEQTKRTPDDVPLSPESLDCLHQFYILRKFQGLSLLQKQLFIREIDEIEERQSTTQTGGTIGVSASEGLPGNL
ncbi:MAG: hypothetical protein JWO78_2464 [Micavibrio sp.]|nr:hypothetical protein [Micavibrio sp.]